MTHIMITLMIKSEQLKKQRTAAALLEAESEQTKVPSTFVSAFLKEEEEE